MKHSSRLTITDADVQKIKKALDPYLLTDKNIKKLREDFKKVFATKKNLENVRNELKSDLGSVRDELRSDFGNLRDELKSDLGNVKSDLTNVKSDLENVKNDLGSVKNELNSTRRELRELSERTEQGFFWVIKEFEKVRAEMLTKSDLVDIMFELKAIREELAVGSYRSKEHSDTLESHNTRITVLEEKALL